MTAAFNSAETTRAAAADQRAALALAPATSPRAERRRVGGGVLPDGCVRACRVVCRSCADRAGRLLSRHARRCIGGRCLVTPRGPGRGRTQGNNRVYSCEFEFGEGGKLGLGSEFECDKPVELELETNSYSDSHGPQNTCEYPSSS